MGCKEEGDVFRQKKEKRTSERVRKEERKEKKSIEREKRGEKGKEERRWERGKCSCDPAV